MEECPPTQLRIVYWNVKRYELMTLEFVRFHLHQFKDKGKHFQKVSDTVDTVSYYFTVFMMSMMMIGMILFNVSPMYNNFKNGAFTNRHENMTLEYSVNFLIPGFNPQNHFILVTIINYQLSIVCSISICTMDLLLCLMVFQVIGHIQVLMNNLKDISQPEAQIADKDLTKTKQSIIPRAELYNEEENRRIHEILKECVLHHKMIVLFTSNMSDFFGIMLAGNYMFHLVACCLLLLECSDLDPNALARYGPLTVIIFSQLIMISVIFEVVATQSEKIKDVVYDIPWESMNIKNQKSVYIILNRVQTPIHVTAMGVTPVGVQTMAGILKSTFSYFTLLRSMNE